MKRFNNKKKFISTIKFKCFIVFFIIINSLLLFMSYGSNMNKDVVVLIDSKVDKVLYQFFSDLITDDVINKKSVGDILLVTKNKNDEILLVNYDLEKTYKILTDVSSVLKNAISDLENGNIKVCIEDDFLCNSSKGLVVNIPLFLNSKNIFLNNLGPRIPVIVRFNETLLTNIKTKVTNYGLNNALLEIYITVEIKKIIITPVKTFDDVFNYDILISALVVNGSVPNFYGGITSNSSILDIPMN